MLYNINLNNNFTKDWVTRKNSKPIHFSEFSDELTIVDLFCGCGGLTAGIIEACKNQKIKPKISLAIDNNESALQVYRQNFNAFSDNASNDNILDFFAFRPSNKLNKREIDLREKIGKVDILVSGPPCQGHSDLNNSTRRNDPRNSLYMSCIQAVKVLAPEFVLIENVPTVVHAKENVVEQTKEVLSALGYEHKELRVDFLNLGLPQSRKRHVLIATKNKNLLESLHINNQSKIKARLGDFIKDIEDVKMNGNLLNSSGKLSAINKTRIDYLFENNVYNLPDSERPDCHKNNKHSYKSNYGRLDYNMPSQTITSGFGSIGQGRYVHPTRRRTITTREAMRIQGFPDDHDFSSINSITALRKMIANAVPPQLSFVFIQTFLDSRNKETFERTLHE